MPGRTRAITAMALVGASLALVGGIGCKPGPVPADQTSLVLDPGPNPGPPARPVSLVWHHHSTGQDLLDGGLLAALKADNIAFHDLNYEEAKVDGYVIGDHTDPPDFPTNFNTPKYFEVIAGWELEKGKQHEVVMFKSCFPASAIESDQKLADYKKWYLSLVPTFTKHPKILFLPLSTPPLTRAETQPEHAARARAFAKWLTTEYVKQAPNVRAFDLFNALAILEGKEHENTLAPQFAAARKDSHPTPEGAKAVTRLFIPWLNRTLKDFGLGHAPAPATARP
ncbi:MAG: hypothetical protein IT371_16675 [Deltaproteobacteria bacterium]|nr:hypothetical protein [Deltaproteobacteria bacterium]